MPRRKTADVAEPAAATTPAYILPNNVKREIPVSSIVLDPTGLILADYVPMAHARLFMLRNGDRNWIPKVLGPRPDGRYAVIHFETA